MVKYSGNMDDHSMREQKGILCLQDKDGLRVLTFRFPVLHDRVVPEGIICDILLKRCVRIQYVNLTRAYLNYIYIEKL